MTKSTKSVSKQSAFLSHFTPRKSNIYQPKSLQENPEAPTSIQDFSLQPFSSSSSSSRISSPHHRKMSVLQHPEAINPHNLQVYDNAAFDDAAAYPSSSIKDSWVPLQPISLNVPQPPESDSTKENRSPISTKSNRMSQGKPLKLLFKQGLLDPPPQTDPKNIDDEIQQIEQEINRLSSRLEALRIEKSGQDPKTTRRQSVGRIVPAKFMEQKPTPTPTSTPTPTKKKMEETPACSRRRGVSLGPSEISSGVRSGKPDNRRKSCFWKLPAVGEEEEQEKEKEKKGGRSLSLSPEPRASVRKTIDSRRGISTVGSKKPVRRDQSTLTCLQPKTLFGGDTCTASNNRASKNSRVVPSRYGQTTTSQTQENDKRRTRAIPPSSGRTPATEARGKKRWDIPAPERKTLSTESSPSAILTVAEELPKIRTVRFESGGSRDSGAAKRVADLIGRKSYFDDDVEGEGEKSSVRQVLEFDEEEEE